MNRIDTCYWGGIHAEIGNVRRSVDSIENVEARFKAHKLPMNPTLLNYGYFRESTLAPLELMLKAISGTLSITGVSAEKIDMVIVATADPEFLAVDRAFMPALLERAGLTRALPLMVTGQECAGLLSALDLASRRVRDGLCRNVLVVSQDRARSDEARIQSFGVVSDASAACLVSGEHPLEFISKGFSLRSSLAGMRGSDDFADRKALISTVSADVLGQGNIPLSDVKKVFATNFFKPLSNFNASCIGLNGQQLYTESTRGVGHCLNADPLINLARFLGEGQGGGQSELYLLQAFAPGFLAAMLIEHRGMGGSTVRMDEEAEAVVQAW